MSEDIPYGPEQKPWKDTLSPLARQDGKLIVTPPSKDPLSLYSFPKDERGITPKLYEVPSTGLDTKQFYVAEAQTAVHSAVQTSNFLGYQCNLGNDYSHLAPYLKTLLNNIGDPFVPGTFTLNSKWMERNVLDYFASLWNAKWPHDPDDPESYWGYVLTMGSSEGNVYALWNARDYLQGKFMMGDEDRTFYVRARASKEKPNEYTPVAFYSQDAHYSIIKAITVCEIPTFYEIGTNLYPNECPLGGDWPTEVPAFKGDMWDSPGSVDVDKLCKLVDFFSAKGYPVLVIFNYGSTFKGAYDNVEEAGTRLMAILERNGTKERWLRITSPQGGTIWRRRNGYWFHVDGALGASYMPFHFMAYHIHRTAIKPGPHFDFRLPFVCSINTSGHKFPGAPWPTGIFMTKTGLQLLPPSQPGYIGSPDTTFAGSRNGLSAIVLWSYISTYNYTKSVEKTVRCLLLTSWLKARLDELEKDIGEDLWVEKTDWALTCRCKTPNPDIVYKYTLATETVTLPGKPGSRTYVHIYVMGFTTQEKLQEMLDDMRKPGAFPPQPPGPIQQKLKEYKIEKHSEVFHRGLLIGERDAGLFEGTRKLLVWPRRGRGFK